MRISDWSSDVCSSDLFDRDDVHSVTNGCHRVDQGHEWLRRSRRHFAHDGPVLGDRPACNHRTDRFHWNLERGRKIEVTPAAQADEDVTRIDHDVARGMVGTTIPCLANSYRAYDKGEHGAFGGA